jgi:excisionase family DNA binding protein
MHEQTRQWLSPDELAAELDVPLATVYTWNHTGRGPAVTRIGKYVRYNRNAVDQWLADRTTEPIAS